MSNQNVTCLTLLGLYAAFDTIDHSILLDRLSSWFRISSTALSWIKSCLLNRSFYVNMVLALPVSTRKSPTGTPLVNIENSESSVFQLLYGVPQRSLKDPSLVLYATFYTWLLSVGLSVADDTQLLLSFSALDFSHNITHLENTITNFLSLNPSKTEFLIFGIPQQLSKLNNPTIHQPNNVILSCWFCSQSWCHLWSKSAICTTHLCCF